MFKIEDLTYEYKIEDINVRALSRIFLHIPQGEWWAIIGANGSGKSTLARHLNGLLLPSSGRVIAGGLDTSNPENIPAIRRKVGIVFQNPDNQIIGNSVEEDIAFGPENLGIPPNEIRQRITACLEQVGLSGFEQKSPGNLSGGQKQRVAIAGALAIQPEALILDEATSMLDPQGCQEVFQVLEKLYAGGMTILMITHNMSEVVFADKVGVLVGGHLMAVGTPSEIFAQTHKLREWGVELPAVNEIGHLVSESIGENVNPKMQAAINQAMSIAQMVEALTN